MTLSAQEIRIAHQARQLVRQQRLHDDDQPSAAAHEQDREERSATTIALREESPQSPTRRQASRSLRNPTIKDEDSYSGTTLPATGKHQPAVKETKQPVRNRIPYRCIQNPENKFCYIMSSLQLLASFPKLSSYLRNWLMARQPRTMIDSRAHLVHSIITTIGALRPPTENESPPLHPVSISWIAQAKMLQLLDPNLTPGKAGDA
eukprot:g63580.t1